MKVTIPYTPHDKQKEIHESIARFKVCAAGRRGGKTYIIINEHIKVALSNPATPNKPIQRSWYVAHTYRQAEMVAWRLALSLLPAEVVKTKNVHKLMIELVNGHIMEFKGCEDPEKLRGVGLVWVGVDEYGQMEPIVWTEILRPMLIESGGGAMFIGTPARDGSPHFKELFDRAKRDNDWSAWLFYTKDNPHIPKGEVEKARRELPPDVFKREFEADFTVTRGLIYDNFKRQTHVIPNYVPNSNDFVVGSIDPGLHNNTAAILTAWDQDGTGRQFWEYYMKDKLAGENAEAILEKTIKFRPAYWIIDSASRKRDPVSGAKVFNKYRDILGKVRQSVNTPGTVWSGIDEVKKLLNVNPRTGKPGLLFTAQQHWTLWEIERYRWFERKHKIDRNEEEKPRKRDDHLMDCIRNMVYGQPWRHRNMGTVVNAAFQGY